MEGVGFTQPERINEYLAVYEQTKKVTGWSTDKRTSMILASLFVGKEERFDAEQLQAVAEYIKGQAGAFSYLRTHLRFSVAGLLLAGTTDPEAAFGRVEQQYEALISNGFSRSIFSHLAACALVLSAKEDENPYALAQKARDVYAGMRRHHFFLTGHDDYPLAALLAVEPGNTEALLEEMEFYYGAFEGVLWKGNDRQFLSHILTYGRSDRRQEVADRTMDWITALRDRGVKVKGMHYPMMGVLALISPPDELIDDVVAAYEQLRRDRAFRWTAGDLALFIAIRIAAQEWLEADPLMGIGMTTAVEAIIQAQQAALIAASSGAAAASSSGNGGGN